MSDQLSQSRFRSEKLHIIVRLSQNKKRERRQTNIVDTFKSDAALAADTPSFNAPRNESLAMATNRTADAATSGLTR
jgi:hypothetical protein